MQGEDTDFRNRCLDPAGVSDAEINGTVDNAVEQILVVAEGAVRIQVERDRTAGDFFQRGLERLGVDIHHFALILFVRQLPDFGRLTAIAAAGITAAAARQDACHHTECHQDSQYFHFLTLH